jgi:hypothetical protein
MPSTPAFILVDIAVSAVFVYAAYEAYRSWKLLRAANWPGANYWRLATLGLAFLAADEFFGVHEALGRTISWAGAPAPWHTEHWDDLILAAYVVAAAAISLWYISELRHTPRVFGLLLLGFAVTSLAVVLDNVIQSPTNEIGQREAVEEFVELAGAVVAALAMRARHLEAAGVAVARFAPTVGSAGCPRGAGLASG